MRLRRLERLQQGGHVVAAEVAHQGRQFVIGAAVEQGCHLALVSQLVAQPGAPGRAAAERQRGVELIGASLDPIAQPLAARLGKRGLLQAAVAQHHNVPAEVAEHALKLGPQALADDGIQALAVVVHHPPGVAEAVLPALQQRLEDVALVHLAVADQCDHAALRPVQAPAVCPRVVLRQGGEQRLRHAQADGAGGEVHVVHVLGARRVGLRAAEAAERLQLGQRLIAEQILDSVEHRAGMRLDGHAVFRPQHRQVERRHDGGNRGARRLVAADLQPVLARAQVVGVVDGPGRKPEQFAL